MKCPHCHVTIHAESVPHPIVEADKRTLMAVKLDTVWVQAIRSPACQDVVLILETRVNIAGQLGSPHKSELIRPRVFSRSPLPAEVPDALCEDYREACDVLAASPKASAALSRRCLQHLLREHAGFAQRDLADQIQAALDSRTLPSDLAEDLDAVRNIGNFAAHPSKSTATGSVVEVAPNEAEWNLGVLEGLFDFYFVRPAERRAKRDALNKKLNEHGKPPMKQP